MEPGIEIPIGIEIIGKAGHIAPDGNVDGETGDADEGGHHADGKKSVFPKLQAKAADLGGFHFSDCCRIVFMAQKDAQRSSQLEGQVCQCQRPPGFCLPGFLILRQAQRC